ncbi:zinc finger protein 555-like [Pararge aegeria]|uniref:zinc finger protein 555-like n=1 Tax=Pararge aegeria TaxID=116150 RepID=UPI0019D0AE70|nr:zinc finger protein 555-like [Pararge aegeria]
MNELCTACLSVGRNLYLIEGSDIHPLYTQILNEISISAEMLSVCMQVCWECHALLRRFQRFKKQAQQCCTELLGIKIQDATYKHKSRLGAAQLHCISFPEPPVKLEPASVKREPDDDTHCEPETFVNDLVYVVGKTLKTTKEKKNLKKKSKQKVKIKKKKAIKNKESSEAGSDFDYDAAESYREKEFPCGQCAEIFIEEKELERHIGSQHTIKQAGKPEPLPEKPQCVECGKMFSSRKTYRYHLNVLHRGQNRYPCPRCGKVYQWKSNLGRHMRSHKARDNNELHCGTCDKRFASVATFRQHLRVSRRHVEEKDFTFMCNECGKKFVNKTRLRDHIDWEHLNKIKFRCQLCNKPFKCHTSLYVHRQNVHKNKEKKENLCHVCGKSYPNAAKLKYHIVAMHTRETPYRCAQCGAAFGWYSSLYRHVREVHYKMKLQPNRIRKQKVKKSSDLLPLLQAGPP